MGKDRNSASYRYKHLENAVKQIATAANEAQE